MKSWHPATKATVAIGGLAVAMLLLTDEGESGSSSAAAALPQTKVAPIPSIAEPLVIKPLAPPVPDRDQVSAIVERPLFAASRRPVFVEVPTDEFVEPEPVVLSDAPPPEPEMAFIGSMTRNESILALVTRGYYGRVESIGVGEEIDGWKVLAIGDSAIALGYGDRRLEYRLFE